MKRRRSKIQYKNLLMIIIGLILLGVILVKVTDLRRSLDSRSKAAGGTPALYVQIHTWYTTPTTSPSKPPEAPISGWSYWSTRTDIKPSEKYTNSIWPHRKIGSLRYTEQITENGPGKSLVSFFSQGSSNVQNVNYAGSYPYIGVYDSADTEIIKYQIRLAKAAGIDAFAVSVYPYFTDDRIINGTKVCPKGHEPYSVDGLDRFQQFLDIAQSENFKVFAETWVPPTTNYNSTKCGAVESWIRTHVRILSLSAHPAYLKLEGRPVISPHWWAIPDDMQSFQNVLNQIEAEANKRVHWMVRGWTNGLLAYTNSDTVRSIATGRILETQRAIIEPNYGKQLSELLDLKNKQPGRKAGVHIFPRFDDTHTQGNPTYSPDRLPAVVRETDKQGNNVLAKQLNNAKAGGADFIFLESWNDYHEQHMIEPARLVDGVERIDPFQDLKTIATFKEVTFTPPPLPPASARDSLKYWDLKGATVAKTSLHPNESTTATCDYGQKIGCIAIKQGQGYWKSCQYARTEGTKAVFNCVAPSTPQTFKHTCATYSGTERSCIPQIDEGPTITVAN